MTDVMFDAADYQQTPGRPLPPNMPGKMFNPHGAAYDYADESKLAAMKQGLTPVPPPVHGTLQEFVVDPATGETVAQDVGIDLTQNPDTHVIRPIARTPEDVAKLGEFLDRFHAKHKPVANAIHDAQVKRQVWKSEVQSHLIESGTDPFYEHRRTARVDAQPAWGSIHPDKLRGYCQETASKLGLELVWSPELSQVRTDERNAYGQILENWVYWVRNSNNGMVAGPTRDLVGIAKFLYFELGDREDAAQRAKDVADHYATLSDMTIVKQWDGEEPTEADALKARLDALEAAK